MSLSVSKVMSSKSKTNLLSDISELSSTPPWLIRSSLSVPYSQSAKHYEAGARALQTTIGRNRGLLRQKEGSKTYHSQLHTIPLSVAPSAWQTQLFLVFDFFWHSQNQPEGKILRDFSRGMRDPAPWTLSQDLFPLFL